MIIQHLIKYKWHQLNRECAEMKQLLMTRPRSVLMRKRLKLKRRNASKDMESKLQKLREEMQEIGVEQRSIREGQRQVREKFEAIETECQKLKRETRLVLQRSARNKIRLAIMFRIFKAREEGDFAKAAELTRLLREMVAREGQYVNERAEVEVEGF